MKSAISAPAADGPVAGVQLAGRQRLEHVDRAEVVVDLLVGRRQRGRAVGRRAHPPVHRVRAEQHPRRRLVQHQVPRRVAGRVAGVQAAVADRDRLAAGEARLRPPPARRSSPASTPCRRRRSRPRAPARRPRSGRSAAARASATIIRSAKPQAATAFGSTSRSPASPPWWSTSGWVTTTIVTPPGSMPTARMPGRITSRGRGRTCRCPRRSASSAVGDQVLEHVPRADQRLQPPGAVGDLGQPRLLSPAVHIERSSKPH